MGSWWCLCGVSVGLCVPMLVSESFMWVSVVPLGMRGFVVGLGGSLWAHDCLCESLCCLCESLWASVGLCEHLWVSVGRCVFLCLPCGYLFGPGGPMWAYVGLCLCVWALWVSVWPMWGLCGSRRAAVGPL